LEILKLSLAFLFKAKTSRKERLLMVVEYALWRLWIAPACCGRRGGSVRIKGR